MWKFVFVFMLAITVTLIAACADMFKPVIFEPDTRSLQHSNVQPTKTAFIKSVHDNREFFSSPRKIEQHELDTRFGTPPQRLLGSIHNGDLYCGHIALPLHLSVSLIIHYAVQKALMENGYKIIEDKSAITPDTAIVDIDIERCWGWADIGSTANFYYEIAAIVMLNEKAFTIRGKDEVHPILGLTRGDEWETFKNAFDKFGVEAKQKLSDVQEIMP